MIYLMGRTNGRFQGPEDSDGGLQGSTFYKGFPINGDAGSTF